MRLLYKDPKGETIGSITRVHTTVDDDGTTRPSLVHQSISANSSLWEDKVVLLEKTLGERDAQINQLLKSMKTIGVCVL